MKRLKIAFLLILLALFLLVGDLLSSEILTNDTIVTMVKAGLGEELIISKIKTSRNQFDLSTDSILKLKAEGVNEKIIKSMLEASAGNSKGDNDNIHKAAVNPLASLFGLPTMNINTSSLYIKKDNKVIEMPPIIAEIQHSMKKHWIPYYFGAGDNWHYIRGEKSVVRLNDKRPVFYTKVNPSSFLLVKLSYHSGKNIRYVVSTGGGYKNTIRIKFDKKSDDIFELSPEDDLEAGEYAFVNSITFYDFGID